MAYTLELLHAADQEAGIPALVDAPNFSAVLNALKAQDLGGDGIDDNTLVLSSGDAIIPGLFFTASSDIYGTAGIADILIQNELGFEAIAFGNHEFDLGTGLLASLIGGTPDDPETPDINEAFAGTAFPYLSANLDFSTDANLAGFVGTDAVAPAPNTIAASTVIDVNGEKIGVVGATTPTIDVISSPGDVTIAPADFGGAPTPEQLDALAAEIQADVDALLAANPDVNKVVLLSHMQQIAIEQALAERLTDVDIIVAGGSNTRLFDSDDTPRDGDTSQGVYPIIQTSADGKPVAVVNTDGNYKYVGRLVIDFDDNGVIIPESYDPAVSGAYRTDAEGVAALGAEGLIDPEIQAIVDALEGVIVAKESNVFGVSNVYLDGLRGSVRTQETNLGNLTADANLAIAKEITGENVLVSIKNGGGIRDDIGQVVVPAGGTGEAVELPNEGIPGVKPDGGISETDIANSLRFNNGLTVLDITRAGLVAVLEHGVAASSLDDSNTQGRFPQVSGIEFSFDLTAPEGDRIQSAAIKDEDGNIIDILVENGELVGDADATVKIVTLGFLAGGGDGYPFQDFGSNFVDLALDEDAPRTGDATFAPDGSEQDALAEYLFDNFNPDNGGAPFDQAETDREADTRLQNLAFREDTVLGGGSGDTPTEPTEPAVGLSLLGTYETGAFDEGAAEINAFDPDSDRLFVVNSNAVTIDILDVSDPSNPTLINQIDATQFGAGANSVAVKNGIVAVAIENETVTDNGKVVFFDADGNFLNEVEVGALPDMVTFTPDGSKVLVANEGEPDDGVNPEGSVSIIDISSGVASATVATADFKAFDGQEDALRAEGVRIFPGIDFSKDAEPEYITVSPDGTQAFVSLQENNAFAVIDLATKQVTDVVGLGYKDYSLPGNGIDASDRDDAINIQNYPVFGMYMPDAIASYEVGGMTYVVTANEGDARDEDARVADLVLDPVAFPNAAELQADEVLGRLEVSTIDGDIDGDGDYDALYAYGARSFTIFDTAGNVIFDSGDQFEQITASLFPDFFNSTNDENGSFDSRSDAKGPEPEGVVIGEVDGSIYAFIGLERIGGVMVYDITDPTNAEFVQYINNRDFTVDAQLGDGSTNPAVGDLGPEGLTFIAAADSPTGEALLAVSNEISGTTSLFEFNPPEKPVEPVDPAEPVAEILDLTGIDGNITANVSLMREAAFDNLLQFYVTDAQGAVNGINPGEAGYEDAVRHNLLAMPQLFVENLTSKDTTITLAGGAYYAPALIIDGDLHNLATIGDAAMGMTMIKRDGNVWTFEDWVDADFNDLEFAINSVDITPAVA
ncbi:bifunctional metallophosphatase/5'-nucleotidase [Leptolyngbya iicbica LK]|uniref:Bifunctional metallophosphatase/5'-nucleotidase n=2 Tax=Cyanophyceae TaxID=3028117 RepID=A0A4Q7E0N6_9CYAN|nr:choice-of-anchor I family protein [Leptolyngbya sp. LK]RZM74914.1 bifunctional metallophosphatase/5'-nucleotidase [Leptolyngbya sp. LK]